MNTSGLKKTRQDILDLLATPGAGTPMGELLAAAQHPEKLRSLPAIPLMLQVADGYLADLTHIPLTTYTLYRQYLRSGERRGYERPLFEKRARLEAATLKLLLGDDSYIDAIHDHIWSICEETNWVMPAHERLAIDLGAVMAGVTLAETITAFGSKLSPEVVQRVRDEIERRILSIYLDNPTQFWWFKGTNNWNGVCNAGIGIMFLLLEKDQERLARGLELVLEGLDVFLATAFEADGTSTEGAGYWSYGLSNLIPFAEMLRQRTGGALDLLALERMKAIAAYPANVMLSPGRFAAFSDCHEHVVFNPAQIQRLAERTGVSDLLNVIAEPAELGVGMDWRNLLWWDGQRPARAALRDVWMRDGAVVKLVSKTPDRAAVALAAKAGHNAENHNQNDVGSFILHIGGETFLADPEAGLYSRDYFSPKRYENIFANSYGHSVPQVGGQLQAPGSEFAGAITIYETAAWPKKVEMSIGGAYAVPGLQITRTLTLGAQGELMLRDRFALPAAQPLEEALITWLETSVSGNRAHLHGQQHDLELTIKSPAGAKFALEVLEKESAANAKPIPLKRLSIALGSVQEAEVAILARALSK